MKYTILLLLSFSVLTSCSKSYDCNCHTNNDVKNYELGHLSSTGKADNQCNAYKTQYSWDTCTVSIFK